MIDTLLSRLQGVRRNGSNGWLALCPGHDDHEPSLSIKVVDGKILVKCFAGCRTEAIVERLGLKISDLSPNGHTSKGQRQIEAIYPYVDANGKPFEVVRTQPKGFYQRRPDGNGGYITNLKGITTTLYRQDKLGQAVDNNEPVYLVEGEKDVDRLLSLGLVATTNPMGAGKWRDSYSQALKGADLVIIPDNDQPGRDHAAEVARSCHGIAKRVRVLGLPSECKDVSDWLDNGGDIEQLKQLAHDCTDYEPSDNGVKLRRMSDVKAEVVSWLWPPYIPKGKVTLLEGDPGVGKSWVSLAVATAVSLGKGLPGMETTEPGQVLLASAEDGLGDTIRPRLDALGADVQRVSGIDEALTLDNAGFTRLESSIAKEKPTLLIIDPLVAYLGAAVDINRANETRSVMARLAKIAETHQLAILAVRHLTKGGAAKPIYRGLGSIDFTASCRSVILAGCAPENPQNRGLVHIKSNLAPLGASIGYELRDGGFYWTGESDLTAYRILAAEDSSDSKSAKDEAADFLRDELAGGPVEASIVWRDAKEAGLSEITVKRAKAGLGIITRRQGEAGKRGGGKFTWELPFSLEYQGYHIEKNDTLNQSSFRNDPLPITDDTLNPCQTVDRCEAVLGMPVEKAIEIWRSEGAPPIYLAPGQICFDLEKLLSQTDVNPDHLKAVKEWLDKRKHPTHSTTPRLS